MFFIILAALMAIIDLLGAVFLKRVSLPEEAAPAPAITAESLSFVANPSVKLAAGDEGVEDAEEREDYVDRRHTVRGRDFNRFSQSQVVPVGTVTDADVEKVLLSHSQDSSGGRAEWTAAPVGIFEAILNLIKDVKCVIMTSSDA